MEESFENCDLYSQINLEMEKGKDPGYVHKCVFLLHTQSYKKLTKRKNIGLRREESKVLSYGK